MTKKRQEISLETLTESELRLVGKLIRFWREQKRSEEARYRAHKRRPLRSPREY